MLELLAVKRYSAIFSHICSVLDIFEFNTDIEKSIITDNVFWKSKFYKHFPHLIDKVTWQGEPENWYIVYEECYMYQYGIHEKPESEINIHDKSFEKAAIFTAAKNGNFAKFQILFKKMLDNNPYAKLHTQTVIKILQTTDFSGYRLCDWLYQNNHQLILDTIFNSINSDSKEEDKFTLSILCNNKSYIELFLSFFKFINKIPKFY